jgi:ComEC/Rec2-related protein
MTSKTFLTILVILAAIRVGGFLLSNAEVVKYPNASKTLMITRLCLSAQSDNKIAFPDGSAIHRLTDSPILSCRSRTASIGFLPSVEVQIRAVGAIKQVLHGRFDKMRRPIGDISRALLLGEASYTEQRKAFRALGLLHLFSVSGLHVGFIMVLINGAVRILLSILSFVIYKPRFWLAINHLNLVWSLSFLILAMYILACGGRPPAIRAFLLLFSGIFLFRLLRIERVAYAFFIQCIAFPASLFSVSFGISWAVFLVLVARHKGVVNEVGSVFIMQLRIFSVTAVWLWRQAIWSIFMNILFIPFAAIMFYFAVLHTFLLSQLSEAPLRLVLLITQFFAEFGHQSKSIVYLSHYMPLPYLKVTSTLSFYFILLNSLRNMAMKEEEQA